LAVRADIHFESTTQAFIRIELKASCNKETEADVFHEGQPEEVRVIRTDEELRIASLVVRPVL
jgi:acetate kinase